MSTPRSGLVQTESLDSIGRFGVLVEGPVANASGQTATRAA